MQENSENPGGGGCGEPRSSCCTPAWVTEGDSVSKQKQKQMINKYIDDLFNNQRNATEIMRYLFEPIELAKLKLK